MPLNFKPEPEPPKRTDLRPPPNYSSRGVQVRLMLLVSALMLVIFAMNEARKPKYYRWMGFEQQIAPGDHPLTNAEVATEEIDTRLWQPENPGKETVDESETATRKEFQPVERSEDAELESTATRRETLDAWAALIGDLSTPNRLRLYQVLKSARDGTALSTEDAQHVPGILKQLGKGWEQYHRQALPAVLEMSDEDRDKPVWLMLLQTLETQWEELRPAVLAIVEGDSLSDQQRLRLDQFKEILDDVALRAVKDNRLATRRVEYDAWFRLFDRIQSTSDKQLKVNSAGRVGFLQLFKQPKNFRGKVVTVRGTARMGYHVRAPKNIYGIKGYYVFVLRPAGGPNSPLLVYALDTPAGFPTLKDKDLDGETTTLEEEVEFTGYFFKNCAYKARDTIRIAPLLLAKRPQWQPRETDGAYFRGHVNYPAVIGSVLGAALLGTLISFVVYVRHNKTSPAVARFGVVNPNHPDHFVAVADDELAPTVDESLQQLASEDSDGEI